MFSTSITIGATAITRLSVAAVSHAVQPRFDALTSQFNGAEEGPLLLGEYVAVDHHALVVVPAQMTGRA